MEVSVTIDFPVGTNVRRCSCFGLIDDSSFEDKEVFNISATINDPILTSSDTLTALVILEEDTSDGK